MYAESSGGPAILKEQYIYWDTIHSNGHLTVVEVKNNLEIWKSNTKLGKLYGK
jgi:hypothetical protein